MSVRSLVVGVVVGGCVAVLVGFVSAPNGCLERTAAVLTVSVGKLESRHTFEG